MPRARVAVRKSMVGLRLPEELDRQLTEVVLKSGLWANRQSFIEQAIREKLDRWVADGRRISKPEANR